MSETTLEKIIQEQATTIRNLTEEISLLREQVAYLTQKRYGKSSEQTAMSGQTSLFEEENTDEDGDLPRRRIPQKTLLPISAASIRPKDKMFWQFSRLKKFIMSYQRKSNIVQIVMKSSKRSVHGLRVRN